MFSDDGKDYFKRVNLQKIIIFLMTGSEILDFEKGTFDERKLLYYQEFFEGLILYRDRVLNFDWKEISENKKKLETEKMYDEIIKQLGNIKYLYLEIGFITGIQIVNELYHCQW